MRKIRVILLDDEESYVNRLTYELESIAAESITLLGYTSRESIRERPPRQQADFILLGEEFWEEITEDGLLADARYGTPVLLWTEGVSGRYAAFPAVCKLQPVSVIAKELYRLAAETWEGELKVPGEEIQIIGVYAPWNSGVSAWFCKLLSQIWAEKRDVLYVSLQESYEIKEQPEEWQEENLADFISYLRTGRENAQLRLKSMCKRQGSYAYLPPPDNPQNVWELTAEDYQRLWQTLKEQRQYGAVVVEFGMFYEGIFRHMQECRRILCPYQEEGLRRIAECRQAHIRQLYQDTEQYGEPDYIRVPYGSLYQPGNDKRTAGLPDELVYGSLGDHIRGLVHGIGE